MDHVIEKTVKFQLNGESYLVESESTIQSLLKELSLVDKRVAIEVNQQIVPRSQYNDYIIQPDDQVEIIVAIGGG